MDATVDKDFARYFEELPDPRQPHLVRHPLISVLAIAILAVITGCDGWQSVAFWARCKEKWLKTFLKLPNGIPSHDTLRKVSRRRCSTTNRPRKGTDAAKCDGSGIAMRSNCCDRRSEQTKVGRLGPRLPATPYFHLIRVCDCPANTIAISAPPYYIWGWYSRLTGGYLTTGV